MRLGNDDIKITQLPSIDAIQAPREPVILYRKELAILYSRLSQIETEERKRNAFAIYANRIYEESIEREKRGY